MSSMLQIRIIHAVHVILDHSIVFVSFLQELYKSTAGYGAFSLILKYLFLIKTYEAAVFFRKIIRIVVFNAVPTAG